MMYNCALLTLAAAVRRPLGSLHYIFNCISPGHLPLPHWRFCFLFIAACFAIKVPGRLAADWLFNVWFWSYLIQSRNGWRIVLLGLFSLFNIQLFSKLFRTRKRWWAPVEPQRSLGLGATNAQINFQKRVTKDGRRVFSGNQHQAANCIVRDERVWRRWILEATVGKGENDAVIKLNLLSN